MDATGAENGQEASSSSEPVREPEQEAQEAEELAGASQSSDVDRRLTRPEHIERAFGAETHPAEATASDPAPSSTSSSEQ